MTATLAAVIYWDSSAVVSALFEDRHTAEAIRWARRSGVHLLSTLAWAEVQAVIGRIDRERVLARALAVAAREALEEGPWRRVHVSPDWRLIQLLSSRWPLRGADLWHLAAACSLRGDLPELRLLSYDERLAAAAREEGLA